MKKKFVLTLALVLMVAASLMAATPIEVSGTFKASYKFEFASAGTTITAPNLDSGKTATTGRISVAGDFWKVTLRPGNTDNGLFTGGDNLAARADIFLDKALAEQGMDMGDLTVKLSVGSYDTMGGLSVYGDPNGTYGDGYYNLTMRGANSAAVTVGYGDMVTAYLAFDPTSATAKDVVASAKLAPVDGISVAFGWANNYTYTVKATGDPKVTGKNAIGASVAVDVAALADLDFGLTVSASDLYVTDNKDNFLLAAVSASIEDIAAYAEYQLLDGTSNVIAKVTYNGIENSSVYAKLTLADLSDIDTSIGAGASYKMGGVTYALDAGYAVANKTFSLTPSVKIAF